MDRPLKVLPPLTQWVGEPRSGQRRVLLLAGLFLSIVLLFCLHRYYTFYASYDQGLFNQVFWNNLHGNFFQSSLTSANSIASLEDGKIPRVNFYHLGQHFVPAFLLWWPLYALFPAPVTLVVLQVLLMTAGGLVLYALARHYLSPSLSLWITGSYYAANAVLGPTFANFYEHCQITPFVFGLLLAMEKRRWVWFWVLAAIVLAIREDTGAILMGVGLYLVVSRRHPRTGVVLFLASFAYVLFITNAVMLQFSDDTKRLYLAHRFRQFVPGDPDPTTLQVVWGILTHPLEFLASILFPLDRTLTYLLRHWLPLAFVPSLSAAAWMVASFPLLYLLLQSGKSALAISLRYALAVVPGLFYGAILWWAGHPDRFTPKIRRLWAGCIALSLVITLVSNPNRVFYFLIPDSIQPWVHGEITRQWQHAAQIRPLLQQVPDDASVSATTYIIPHLSSRRAIIRLPSLQIQNDAGQVVEVDYGLADFWQLEKYQVAFEEDRSRLLRILPVMDQIVAQNRYGILAVRDGVVLFQRGVPSQPEALVAWQQLRQHLEQVTTTKNSNS